VLPDSLPVLVVALALVPGWLYLRLRERRRPPSTAAGLSQLLEVVAVGLATTGISVFVLSLIPHRWVPWLIDVEAWAAVGDDHLRQNIRASVVSVGAVLVLASLAAVALHNVLRASSSDSFDAESSVWGHALGRHPEDTVPWVGLQLRDGPLVEGVLHSLSLGQEAQDERDIALKRPIRVTEKGQQAPTDSNVDRLVVPSREILHITVIHIPEATTKGTGGQRLAHGGVAIVLTALDPTPFRLWHPC
jgi:hypothetical protein